MRGARHPRNRRLPLPEFKVHRVAAPAGFKRHGGAEGRGSAAARGYGAAWQRYAKRFRALFPWCRRCEAKGIATPTAVVDHIIRVDGPNDPLFWLGGNHQPLCAPCHGIKTGAERRGEAFTPARPYPD